MDAYEDLQYQNSKDVAKSGILGFFIGLAVIIPGVSGSTIAILFKLYDKLLFSISHFMKRIKLCLFFLFPIVLGAILGLVLGFFTIKKLLDLLPFAIMALFGGLMIGAFPVLSNEIKNEKLTLSKILLFTLGISIPLGISISSTFLQGGNQSLKELEFYHYILFLGIGYVIAVTQIVPGLSATAILMAFGYFKPLIDSVSISYITSNPNILLVYACLGIGFLIGLVTFSGLLTTLLNKQRTLTYFMIVGLSLGSIFSIFFNPDIYEVYQSWIYGNLSFGVDLGFGIFLFIAGILISATFLKLERNKKN